MALVGGSPPGLPSSSTLRFGTPAAMGLDDDCFFKSLNDHSCSGSAVGFYPNKKTAEYELIVADHVLPTRKFVAFATHLLGSLGLSSFC